MPRYFRDRTPGSIRNSYIAVSDKTIPVEESFYEQGEHGIREVDHHPVGSISTIYTPRKYFPNFSTTDDISGHNSHFSKATGLSQQFLDHLENTVEERNDASYYSGEDANEDDEALANHLSIPTTMAREDRGIPFAKAVSYIKKSPEAQPDTLFTDIPPKVKIDEAFFDPRVNNLFPTTASLIKQDHPDAEIVASGDLSEYSSKLAKRAAERGLVTGSASNPEMEVTNSINFSRQSMNPAVVDFMASGGKEVPQTEIASARQSLRNQLRASRNNQVIRKPQTETKLSSQFDHPKLPGMENF